jgi:ParB/RepB/Spo0J family partition protein
MENQQGGSSGYAEPSVTTPASPDRQVDRSPYAIPLRPAGSEGQAASGDGPQGTATTLRQIPISQIKPNVQNPRHSISQQEIDAMASSLLEMGQKTPIKVRQSGPDEYELVGGHIRLLGAQKANLTTLNALVLKLTPEAAIEEAIYDNRNQPMSWLDNYISIETLIALKPDLTQQQVADRLEIERSLVSKAQKLLNLLNKHSRELICEQFTKSSDSQLTQRVVYTLTGIGSLVWSQDQLQAMVERALKVVIDKKLTESQTKKLVEWVKTGNSPESYSDSGKSKKVKKLESVAAQPLGDGSVDDGVAGFEKLANTPNPQNQQLGEEALSKTGVASSNSPAYSAGSPRNDGNLDSLDPNSSYWQKIPSNVKVTRTQEGYRIVATLAPNEGVPGVYGLLANLEHLKGIAGEPEDLQFRKALPQVMEEARKARLVEKGKAGKSENVTAEKVESVKVVAEENNSSETSNQKPGEKDLSGTGVASSLTPAYSADIPRNDSNLNGAKEAPIAEAPSEGALNPTLTKGGNGGFVEQIKQAVRDNLHLAPGEITEDLMKDGKQAINYQIRRGMRNILKDLF